MHRQVTYELLSLEALLATGKKLDRAQQTKVKSELIRIRQALLSNALLLTDHQHVQRYIQGHHYGLVQLLDKLRPDANADLLSILLDLLREMEKTFAPHIDPDANVPIVYRNHLAEECNKIVAAFNKLLKDAPVSERLQLVFIRIFKRFSTATTVTYHQHRYVTMLKEEITHRLKKPTLTEEDLRQLLLWLDCNSLTAFGYYTHQITEQLHALETKNEKHERLMMLRREITQAPVKPDLHYHPKIPSLRTQLLTFLSEELKIMESVASPPPAKASPSGDFRLRTELSVSQLACLLKTLLDNRIITNPNVSELLRFLAQTTVTKRAEAISFDSLRAKYYNIESGTRETTRQVLQALAKSLS